MTPSPRRARVLLAAVVFAVLLAQVLLYPGIDRLVTALGAETTLDASMWFLAVEFGGFVVFAPVWGALSDAVGRRRDLIVAGALGGAVGYAALAFLPGWIALSFEAVVALRFLQGAATIGAFSLAMTMLMDLEGGHGRNMGAAGIAIGLGTALGAPLGGQLAARDPLWPLFGASAILAVVGLLSLTLADRVPDGDRPTIGRVLTGLRSTPALGLPYAFGFIDRLTAGFFALVGTLYFRQVYSLDPAATGLVLGLFFAPFALLQYPLGMLSDRVGRTVPVVVGSGLYGIGVIAVGFAPSLLLAGAGMVAVGVLGALMAPATMALVTDLAGATERGVAMAGFNSFGSLGFLAGILVGGGVADRYGFGPAFLVAGGIEIALALVAIPVFLGLEIDRQALFAEDR